MFRTYEEWELAVELALDAGLATKYFAKIFVATKYFAKIFVANPGFLNQMGGARYSKGHEWKNIF